MKMIYKVTLVLVITYILPIIAFGYFAFNSMQSINNKATQESVNYFIDTEHVRLKQIAKDKAFCINHFFQNYYNDVELLRKYYDFICKNSDLYNTVYLKNLYPDKKQNELPGYGYIHPVYGVYADFDRRGEGCPWLPKRVVERAIEDEKFKKEITVLLCRVMLLNQIFLSMDEKNKDTLDLVWIVTGAGVTNVYPPYHYRSVIRKDPSVINLNESEEDYVRLLNPENNPMRKIRWLEPYFDRFKRVWMTSCVCPIYEGNTFIGTMGMDILLPTITETVLNIKIGKEGYAFLIAPNGRLIAIPEEGVKEMLWNEIDKKAIRETFLPLEIQKWSKEMIDAFSLIDMDKTPDNTLREIIQEMEDGKTDIRQISLSGKEKLISFAPIENTGWSIGLILPVNEVIAPSQAVKNTITEGTRDITRKFIIIALVIICVSIIVGSNLHYYIIKPLTTFTKKVENINWGNLEFKELESPRNDEVGHLYTKFSEMVLALKKAKTNIMQKTNELEFANKKLFLKSKELENVNEELKAANKKLEAAQLELKKWGQDLEKTVVERSKDLEKTQEQLHRSEKLAVLGKLAGSLSHELRNPLGAIKNAAFYLAMPKKERDIGAEQDNLRIIKNQVKIAEKILENTLDFARPREIELETVNMSEIIDGVISDMVIPENIIIVKEYKECVKMLCDPIHLRHVFTNIIANSIQAIKNEGKINVSVGKELDKAKVVIEDTGQGIEMEDLEKVFEPLYSKKSKGIGLGLYIVKSVIERLNGTIEIKSVFGQGTTVTILLPL